MQAKSITWRAKVAAKKQSKRVTLDKDFAGIAAGSLLFVATPQIVADYVKKIPRGETRTIQRLRNDLARNYRCDATCPVSTAIFLRMAAEAAWEGIKAGESLDAVTPFWRVIEPGSTIAKKLSADSAWLAHQREVESEPLQPQRRKVVSRRVGIAR